MENPLILVADADTKNLQILRDSLESSGFSVTTANDGMLAWEKIQSENPDLILSEVNLPNYDGFQLLEKLKENPTTSIIPVMFLTNRREIQDRVRSLRGGVKDYMIKPLHVKEVIARIRMILRRIERIKSEDSETSKKMAGRLEEYSVIELIDNFGADRKTGVLQIYNEHNRNGEIWFKFGAVVHASFGTLKAEKAVYQMLPWQQGHFIMTFKDVQVPETINVSNLGLLLHGYKRMEQREQLFKQLPSPETTFVLTESFRKVVFRKELSQEASKFIALIDGRRDIMQIIDESVYDDIYTLERLAKLYKQGLIRQGKPSDQTSTEINIESPIDHDLKENLPDSSEQLVYEDVQKDDNDIISAPQEQESAIPPETNDSQTDNNFPPPDYDALDNENENELESPSHNGIKQPDFPETAFGGESESEGKHAVPEEPKTEEISNLPEEKILQNLGVAGHAEEEENASPFSKNEDVAKPEKQGDYIESQPEASPPIPMQIKQHDGQSNQVVGRQEESIPDAIENELKAQDNYHSPAGIPEPLKYSDFSPNIDITNALSGQKKEPLLKASVEPGNRADSSIMQTGQSIDKAEKHGQDQFGEFEITDKTSKPEHDQPDVKNLTYSFPLRSYGKPNIEKKPEKDGIPLERDGTESRLKDGIENSKSFEIDHTRSTEQTQAQPEPRKQFVPPKLPQVQKANVKIPPRKPANKHLEQKAFTDLEHLIPKQHPPQKQQEAEHVAKPPKKVDEHISAGTTTLLLKYFENKQIQNPKFVLIGTEKKYIESFATYLLDGKTLIESKSPIFEYFAAKVRKLNPSIAFTVVGVTMEKQFTHLLDKISSDLAGYILLMDASDKTKLNYISYLHKTLKEKYDCDSGIAIYDGTSKRNLALDTIKDLIGAKKEDLVVKLEKNNERDHMHFLREILNEKKKNTHN